MQLEQSQLAMEQELAPLRLKTEQLRLKQLGQKQFIGWKEDPTTGALLAGFYDPSSGVFSTQTVAPGMNKDMVRQYIEKSKASFAQQPGLEGYTSLADAYLDQLSMNVNPADVFKGFSTEMSQVAAKEAMLSRPQRIPLAGPDGEPWEVVFNPNTGKVTHWVGKLSPDQQWIIGVNPYTNLQENIPVPRHPKTPGRANMTDEAYQEWLDRGGRPLAGQAAAAPGVTEPPAAPPKQRPAAAPTVPPKAPGTPAAPAATPPTKPPAPTTTAPAVSDKVSKIPGLEAAIKKSTVPDYWPQGPYHPPHQAPNSDDGRLDPEMPTPPRPGELLTFYPAPQPSTKSAYPGAIPRALPKLNQQALLTIGTLHSVQGLVNRLILLMQTKDENGQTWKDKDDYMDIAKERARWLQYAVLHRRGDPSNPYTAIAQLDKLLAVAASRPYSGGIRNFTYINLILQHLPDAAVDTPAMMWEKLTNLIPVMRDMEYDAHLPIIPYIVAPGTPAPSGTPAVEAPTTP
jgi:hypothetical protein